MKSILRRLRDRVFAGLARQQDLDRLYGQISGLLQIQNAMQGKSVLRPMRGWAISPDAMAWLLADLQERKSSTVIEFGSGQSTVVLASYLQNRNGGRLISVEHDPEYLAHIQRQTAACGLSDRIQFFHAPLKQAGDNIQCPSYDLDVLPDVAIDLALVDGPPISNGIFTRLKPLQWAVRHLKPGGVVFLDDSAREVEQACLKQLKTEHPALRIVPRTAEKGLVELRLD